MAFTGYPSVASGIPPYSSLSTGLSSFSTGFPSFPSSYPTLGDYARSTFGKFSATSFTTSEKEKKKEESGEKKAEPVEAKPAVRENITQAIGRTPLVFLNRIADQCYGQVAVKLETMNPTSSASDRAAWAIVAKAEKQHRLTKDIVLIEASAGNLAVSLASICAVKGYKLIVVIPEFMSVEKRCLAAAFGAIVIVTPMALGMKGAVNKARRLAAETPNSFFANQFYNSAVVDIHEQTTGPEIWVDTAGMIDTFVCGIGTCGTASGVGKFLKAQNSQIRIVGVEPADAAVLNGLEHPVVNHTLQGIGAGFVGDNVESSVIDDFFTVRAEEVVQIARKLPLQEGILCCMSGAAAVCAALQIAKQPDMEGKLIVAYIPGGAEREISAPVFDEIRSKSLYMAVVPQSECEPESERVEF